MGPPGLRVPAPDPQIVAGRQCLGILQWRPPLDLDRTRPKSSSAARRSASRPSQLPTPNSQLSTKQQLTTDLRTATTTAIFLGPDTLLLAISLFFSSQAPPRRPLLSGIYLSAPPVRSRTGRCPSSLSLSLSPNLRHQQPCRSSAAPSARRQATRSASSQNTSRMTRACSMTASLGEGRVPQEALGAPPTMCPRTRYVLMRDGFDEPTC